MRTARGGLEQYEYVLFFGNEKKRHSVCCKPIFFSRKRSYYYDRSTQKMVDINDVTIAIQLAELTEEPLKVRIR